MQKCLLKLNIPIWVSGEKVFNGVWNIPFVSLIWWCLTWQNVEDDKLTSINLHQQKKKQIKIMVEKLIL